MGGNEGSVRLTYERLMRRKFTQAENRELKQVVGLIYLGEGEERNEERTKNRI